MIWKRSAKATGDSNSNDSARRLEKRLESQVDLWVFIDGTLKWKALQIRESHGVSRVAVAIRPGDRFLTLVATDGEDGGIGGDQGVFGDPVLETVVSEEK